MELFDKALTAFSVASAIIAVAAYIWFPRLLPLFLKEKRLYFNKLLGELKEWDCFQLGWKNNGGRTFVVIPHGFQPGKGMVRVMDLGMRSGDTFDLLRSMPVKKVFSVAPKWQK